VNPYEREAVVSRSTGGRKNNGLAAQRRPLRPSNRLRK